MQDTPAERDELRSQLAETIQAAEKLAGALSLFDGNTEERHRVARAALAQYAALKATQPQSALGPDSPKSPAAVSSPR